MKIRIINYSAGIRGVPRFVLEVAHGLQMRDPDIKLEFISHGLALRQFQRIFQEFKVAIRFIDMPPPDYWRSAPRRLFNIRGTGLASMYLSRSIFTWGFQIPDQALRECDLVWIPYLHFHRLPGAWKVPVVATLHDMNLLSDIGGLPAFGRRHERQMLLRAMQLPVHFVTYAQATIADLKEYLPLALAPDKFHVIPITGNHVRKNTVSALPQTWSWTATPYLLCPAHLYPNKNQAFMLRVLAGMPNRLPVVLTGADTDLPRLNPRARKLRALMKSLGLVLGRDVHPLGFVASGQYDALLRHARAVIMPTLAEGMCFPVEEAIWAGVPVLCSDIPVMREHMQRIGADVIWFDPRRPASLHDALLDFQANYDQYKARALEQNMRLRPWSWQDVAHEYYRHFQLFMDEAKGARAANAH